MKYDFDTRETTVRRILADTGVRRSIEYLVDVIARRSDLLVITFTRIARYRTARRERRNISGNLSFTRGFFAIG